MASDNHLNKPKKYLIFVVFCSVVSTVAYVSINSRALTSSAVAVLDSKAVQNDFVPLKLKRKWNAIPAWLYYFINFAFCFANVLKYLSTRYTTVYVDRIKSSLIFDLLIIIVECRLILYILIYERKLINILIIFYINVCWKSCLFSRMCSRCILLYALFSVNWFFNVSELSLYLTSFFLMSIIIKKIILFIHIFYYVVFRRIRRFCIKYNAI